MHEITIVLSDGRPRTGRSEIEVDVDEFESRSCAI